MGVYVKRSTPDAARSRNPIAPSFARATKPCRILATFPHRSRPYLSAPRDILLHCRGLPERGHMVDTFTVL